MDYKLTSSQIMFNIFFIYTQKLSNRNYPKKDKNKCRKDRES